MVEATLHKDAATIKLVAPTGGWASGQLIQLPDGRAGIVLGLEAVLAGEVAEVAVSGRWNLAKTAGVAVLRGGRLFWDRSANTATPLCAVADADFFIGVSPPGAAPAATTVEVELNAEPNYLIELHRDAFDTVLVGGATLVARGGQFYAPLTSANEAQKADLLSVKAVPKGIPCILEAVFRIQTASGADVADLNVGMANETHASDADSIAESAFIHLDSNGSLNIYAESDDGTHEVAATDTTVDYAAGTDIEVWIDLSDLASVKFYVNGVRRLSATTFDISSLTGPLKAIFHYEKSANAAVGEARISHLAVRATDLAA